MLVSRRALLGTAATAIACPAIVRAQSSTPIRVGEINSYAAQPASALPYRLGWEMAVAHVNDLGGVDGRRLEFISRDDGGDPGEAVRIAQELVQDQKVDILAGGCRSDIALAISAAALQMKKVYVAGEPLASALTWERGNRYTYRVRPSTFMQAAMLVESAAALPAKTWATVAPDYEYGRSAVKWFRQLLQAKRSDVTFVAEQWPSPGHIDAAATLDHLAQAAPDAVFCALLGTDLAAFARQGAHQAAAEKRITVSMLAGEPEYLDQLGPDTPVGWIATGYPWSLADEPFNKSFAADYVARYRQPPRMSSVVAVAMVNAIVSGILKSGGTESERMADGFADATFNTPFGLCRFRAVDHQSTMGTYVGRLVQQNGHGGMVDWRYVAGDSVMPPDAVVQQLRPS